MSDIGDWVMVAWLVIGAGFGLWAANWTYSDYRAEAGERAFTAVCVFVFCVMALPAVLAVGAVAGLAWLGGNLLPAVRRERAGRRAVALRTETETRQLEIDKLHFEVGLPPVDWEGRQP